MLITILEKSDIMSESMRICLSCGICCDGTLIGFVQLHTEEIPAVRKIIEVEEEGQQGIFLQPCKQFSCNGCKVYAERPIECGKYECGLLKSAAKKELTFEDAVDVVAAVKQKTALITEHIASLDIKLHSKSFYFQMFELKKLFRKNKSNIALSPSQEKLLAEVEELDEMLVKYYDVSFK